MRPFCYSVSMGNVKKTRKTKTRDLERTRKQILDVAFLEIYRHGFQGVSVDDIVKKTDLTKGAFYHCFPTKWDLGYALVEDVITPMILDRWITPLTDHKNPLAGMLKQMEMHIVGRPVETLKYGCPLNNLVQEMAPIDRGFKTRLQAALNLWIDETEKHIKRAQNEGYIKKTVKARAIAQFVVMTHEGYFGLIKGLDDPSAVNSLFGSVKQYFDSLAA